MQRNILIKFENIMNSRQQFGDPRKIDDLKPLNYRDKSATTGAYSGASRWNLACARLRCTVRLAVTGASVTTSTSLGRRL